MLWRVAAAALLCMACDPVERDADPVERDAGAVDRDPGAVERDPGPTASPIDRNLPTKTDPSPVDPPGIDPPGVDPPGVELWLDTRRGTTVGDTPALAPTLAPADLEAEAADDDDDEREVPGTGWITHEVAPRETIALLALRYRVDPGKLRGWNGLGRRAGLRPGQRLRVLAGRTPPQRERVAYTVREGDTWGTIARAHGIEPVDLRAYNSKRTGRRLRPGLELAVWRDPAIADAVAADAPPPGPAAAIAPGGFSVGRPSDGRLVNGVQIPASADYDRRYPASAWGTTFAVRHLVDTLHRWRAQTGYEGLLRLGAMSRQRGRQIGGHRSHQSGRDIDIRLPLREGIADEQTPTPRRADWAAIYALVRAFADSGAVTRIFLDYRLQNRLYKIAKAAGADRTTLRRLIQFPRGRHAARGLVRHSPGHDIHLHVRFACADYESECAGR